MTPISRRNFLDSAAATALTFSLLGGPGSAAAAGLNFGPPGPFTFDGLVATARERASRAYVPPERPAPDIVQAID
jgi:periplasmic glucans biosynthesis protein